MKKRAAIRTMIMTPMEGLNFWGLYRVSGSESCRPGESAEPGGARRVMKMMAVSPWRRIGRIGMKFIRGLIS